MGGLFMALKKVTTLHHRCSQWFWVPKITKPQHLHHQLDGVFSFFFCPPEGTNDDDHATDLRQPQLWCCLWRWDSALCPVPSPLDSPDGSCCISWQVVYHFCLEITGSPYSVIQYARRRRTQQFFAFLLSRDWIYFGERINSLQNKVL